MRFAAFLSPNLQNSHDGRVQVVSLGGLGVQDVYGVHMPREDENHGVVEELGELLRVKGGRRNNQLGGGGGSENKPETKRSKKKETDHRGRS